MCLSRVFRWDERFSFELLESLLVLQCSFRFANLFSIFLEDIA